MGTLVNYATDKGVAILTLTDPPVNAYTHEMMKELDSCILEARFDQDVHVIVITGHGDKYFCAGANINMLSEADEAFKYYFCLHANETLLRLEHTPKLVIAALNGHSDRRRARDRSRLRSARRRARARTRSACPRSASASCRARAARSGSRASSARGSRWSSWPRATASRSRRALRVRASSTSSGATETHEEFIAQGRRLRPPVLPAAQGGARGRAHEARGAGSARDAARAGPRARARAAGASSSRRRTRRKGFVAFVQKRKPRLPRAA